MAWKLEFHGTDTDTDTNNNTDTDILADFHARILARKSACPATSPFSLPRAEHARRSSPTCPPTCPTRALFVARILARKSVGDARVYTCTCTVHDKLSCTRLQNYTINASQKSVLVSLSVSVPWNSSLTVERSLETRVRISASPLPDNSIGQAAHTHVPLSPSSIIWYLPMGDDEK